MAMIKKPKTDAQAVTDTLRYLESLNERDGNPRLVEAIAELRALLSRMMAEGGAKGRGEETETP